MEINVMSSFQGVYTNLHVPALVIGGVFALNALILSLMLIFRHLRSYTNPYIISLWVSRLSMICDILRSCYEAFALYSFGRYLVACLGGEPRVVDMLENKANEELQEQLLEEGEKKGSRKEGSFCDFFCHPIFLGKDMYTTVKFGLVQYMILKTACAFLSLILELLGVYVLPCDTRKAAAHKATGKIHKFQGYCVCHLMARCLLLLLRMYMCSPQNHTTTVETKENVESPGTSIRESVQDVVEDVVLTISQAIEPVEKGVTKIQETMHHISVKPNKESEYEINEHTNERIVDGDTVDVESEIEIRPEGSFCCFLDTSRQLRFLSVFFFFSFLHQDITAENTQHPLKNNLELFPFQPLFYSTFTLYMHHNKTIHTINLHI
ncbi:organic solute transporter ostalpha protein (DUF300) [Rhynchospora pubera]|uniref:Organic solute transporter ostalpha protein (DUF300) n=1 Tax=Rhynchospora pubera TaxID=906938 RepID=A0AAV8HFP1_9POAL|nr:organic solute transporter ostalpha protein (DUF300) [Rhynchospora pubera]